MLDRVKVRFHNKGRHSTSDGDSSINRAERAHIIDSEESQLRLICVLHKLCNSRVDSNQRSKYMIDILKNVVLSLFGGGMMRFWRRAYVKVFQRKVSAGGVVRDHLPSRHVRERNEELLIEYIDTKSKKDKLTFTAICSTILDDFLLTDRIYLFPLPGESDGKCVRRNIRTMTKNICSVSPKSFPSHKWQKVLDASRWCGKHECCHGVLLDTMEEFFGVVAFSVGMSNVDNAAQPQGGAAIADGLAGDDPAMHVDPPPDGAAVGANAAAPAAVGVSAKDQAMEAKRLEQHRFRQTALRLLRDAGHDGLVAGLLAFTRCLKLHIRIMDRNFWRAGEKHDKAQEVHAVKKLTRHEEEDGVPIRRYRVEEAFDTEFEDDFLSSTWNLMNDAWSTVPTQCTQNVQNDTFAVLSRGQCHINRLKDGHVDYPYKGLSYPWHQYLIPEIKSDSDCPRRLDPWFAEWIARNPSLHSPTTKTKIESKLVNLHEETLATEKRNGYFRMFLTEKTNMRKSVDLGGLNMFLCTEHRKTDTREPRKRDKVDAHLQRVAEKDEKKAKTKQRQRKLSLWNYFFTRKPKGIPVRERPSDAEISEEWNRIKADPAKLAEIEADATRDLIEETLGGARPSVAGAAARGDGGVSPAPAPPHPPELAIIVRNHLAPMSVEEASHQRAIVKCQNRAQSARARQIEKQDDNELEDYRDIAVKAILQDTIETVPGMSADRAAWTGDVTHPDGDRLQHYVCRLPAIADMAEAIATVKASGQQKGLSVIQKASIAVWRGQNREIKEVPDATADGKDSNVSPPLSRLCWVFNKCVCGIDGKEIVSKYGFLIQASKREYRAGGDRDELTVGDAVALLFGRRNVMPETPVESFRVLHIGAVSLKPYTLDFTELEPDTDEVTLPAVFHVDPTNGMQLLPADATLWLRATQGVFTDIQLAKDTDPALQWTVFFCKSYDPIGYLAGCSRRRWRSECETLRCTRYLR